MAELLSDRRLYTKLCTQKSSCWRIALDFAVAPERFHPYRTGIGSRGRLIRLDRHSCRERRATERHGIPSLCFTMRHTRTMHFIVTPLAHHEHRRPPRSWVTGQ